MFLCAKCLNFLSRVLTLNCNSPIWKKGFSILSWIKTGLLNMWFRSCWDWITSWQFIVCSRRFGVFTSNKLYGTLIVKTCCFNCKVRSLTSNLDAVISNKPIFGSLPLRLTLNSYKCLNFFIFSSVSLSNLAKSIESKINF